LQEEDADFELNTVMHGEGDDESSLAEEEQMESQESIKDEVSALERESDMPIEDLLALYGYDDDGGTVVYGSSSPNGSEALNQDSAVGTTTLAKGDSEHVGTSSTGTGDRQDETMSEKAKSKLRKLFPTRGRVHTDDNQFSDSSSEDEDYVPLEDWKKEIHVGEDYQAVVPDKPDTDYQADAQMDRDLLVWDPSRLQADQVTSYLEQAVWRTPEGANGIEALPLGAPDGDNEKALFVLHKCGYEVQKALEALPHETDSSFQALPAPWSEEDCVGFETGLRMFGKDFPSILEKLPGRSLGELVEFYYLWKKTERHDHFVQQYQMSSRQDFAIPAHLDGLEKYGDTDLDSAISSRAPSPGRGDTVATIPRTTNPETGEEVFQSVAIARARNQISEMSDVAGSPSSSSLVVESGHSYARHERMGKRKADEMPDMNKRKRGRVPIKLGSKHEDHTYNTADGSLEKGTKPTGNRAVNLPTPPGPTDTPLTTTDYLMAKETLPESSDDSFNNEKSK
jgi:hypothetical protein